MQWWQIKKRDADLERELRSDLELEEEEQRRTACPRKKPATPRDARIRQSHSDSRANPRGVVELDRIPST